MKPISIIVAFADDQAIGLNGGMPWHLPADLKHFKQITLGQPVIMGRRTWDSLPRKPLPGRLNIVVSKSITAADGAVVVSTPAEAVAQCPENSEPFIIGGATLYRHFLPLASQLFITRIYTSVEADTWFPLINEAEWDLVSHKKHINTEGPDYAFQHLKRKPTAL